MTNQTGELVQIEFVKPNLENIAGLDPEITPLINLINRLPFIYTTESC